MKLTKNMYGARLHREPDHHDQEDYHRGAGTHPGPEYRWETNGEPGAHAHKYDLEVPKAFYMSGAIWDAGVSYWNLIPKPADAGKDGA